MTREDRIRFRDFILEALMVREGATLDAGLAAERANNIATGVDADFDVTAKRENTPTGRDVHETMSEHADRVIK